MRHGVRLYALVLGAGFLLWPVSLGVPAGMPRVVWVLAAAGCAGFSILMARRAAEGGETAEVDTARAPWWLIGLIVLPALAAGVRMPLTIFGDEETIMLPTLTLSHMIADRIGWIPLVVGTLVALAAGVWFVRRFPERFLLWVIAAFTVIALVVAVAVGRTESEFVRYPPLVHLTQGLITVFTGGHPSLFRLQTIAWWVLTGLAFWHLMPQWPRTARFLAFLVIGLTPLGWIYHVLLYQSSGEMFFASSSALLIGQTLTRADRAGRGGMAGMAFGLWILYRPTALAPAAACAIVLFLLGYRRAARDIACIALPVGLLWILVYLIGSFQYDFLQPGGGRMWTFASLLVPIRETLWMLPSQLTVPGLIVLVAGSFFLARTERARYLPLFAVWVIALVNTGVHQLLTIERWQGYGRFSALMILPLAFVVAGFWGQGKWGRLCAGIVTLVLAVFVPWNIGSFMQEMRTVPPDRVERTVTGGLMPTVLPSVVDDLLRRGKPPAVMLAPSYAFLDLFIARGFLSVADRTAIKARSDAWQPGDAVRPLIVHAPQPPVHFLGNLPAEQEKRLRDAAAWVASQPGVRTEVYGRDRVYVLE